MAACTSARERYVSHATSTSFTVTVSTPSEPLPDGATHMLSPHALPR
jgi:intein-encoded DNA endonuclease-like protein